MTGVWDVTGRTVGAGVRAGSVNRVEMPSVMGGGVGVEE